MSDNFITNTLRPLPLFQGLSNDELSRIVSLFYVINFKINDNIISEDEVAKELFILVEGSVEIIKSDKNDNAKFNIITLGSGDVIGEFALVDMEPRSATVKAVKPSVALALSIERLTTLLDVDLELGRKVYYNLSRNLSRRLRRTDEITVGALKAQLLEARLRTKTAILMVTCLFFMLMYVYSLGLIKYFSHNVSTSTFITIPILVIYSSLIYFFIKKIDLPVSIYGLTLKNSRKNLYEALGYSLPLMMLLVLLKYTAIKFIPSHAHEPLFNPTSSITKDGDGDMLRIFMIGLFYLLAIPLQELICRGVFQGSLQFFLIGPYKNIIAIFLATLLFSMFHMTISYGLTLLVFPLSLFWGWMYLKQKSIVGVCASHILLGVWALNIVGLQHFV